MTKSIEIDKSRRVDFYEAKFSSCEYCMAASSGGEVWRIPHWSNTILVKFLTFNSRYTDRFLASRDVNADDTGWLTAATACTPERTAVSPHRDSGVPCQPHNRRPSNPRASMTQHRTKKTTLCNDRVSELESIQLHATMMIIIATMKMNPLESKLRLNWGLRKQVMRDSTCY